MAGSMALDMTGAQPTRRDASRPAASLGREDWTAGMDAALGLLTRGWHGARRAAVQRERIALDLLRLFSTKAGPGQAEHDRVRNPDRLRGVRAAPVQTLPVPHSVERRAFRVRITSEGTAVERARGRGAFRHVAHPHQSSSHVERLLGFVSAARSRLLPDAARLALGAACLEGAPLRVAKATQPVVIAREREERNEQRAPGPRLTQHVT